MKYEIDKLASWFFLVPFCAWDDELGVPFHRHGYNIKANISAEKTDT